MRNVWSGELKAREKALERNPVGKSNAQIWTRNEMSRHRRDSAKNGNKNWWREKRDNSSPEETAEFNEK